MKDAVDEAARRAGLKPGDVHAEYLEKKPSSLAKLIEQIAASNRNDEDKSAGDAFTRMAAERRAAFARALGDVKRIGTGAAIQARCLECDGLGGTAPRADDARLLDLVLARFAL